MNTTRILVSSELESYREALTEVFRTLYPGYEVFAVEPGDVERKVETLRPSLVVCSRATGVVQQKVPVWVELYPDGSPRAAVSVSGDRREITNIQLADLLSLADEAGDLARRQERAPRWLPGPPQGSAAG